MQTGQPTELPPLQPPPPKRASTARVWIAVFLGIVAILVVVTVLWFFRAEPTAPAPVPPDAPTAQPPISANEGEAAATLEGSDDRARAWAAKASDDARWLSWFQSGDLIRRAVGALWNVSQGNSPRAFVPFLAPEAEFQIEIRGEQTFVAPQSFARYDPVANTLAGVDVTPLAQAWRELEPFLVKAHREIAPPARTLSETVDQATAHLLRVRVPDTSIEVVEKGALYEYADPQLEQLSAAQKHLVRMGPRNAAIVQGKLGDLRRALGLTPVQ